METTFTKAVKAFIEHFGSQAAAAKAIGVKQPAISGWLNGGHRVSARNAHKVEAVTGGAVKAVDLCPDVAPVRDTAA